MKKLNECNAVARCLAIDTHRRRKRCNAIAITASLKDANAFTVPVEEYIAAH
jgi:hypothetical protein